ncbi:hypothetical protein FRC12_001629 [Ceratobasidium sp. 428]|nr:hypothetical protein FRC12_001629 [Ceratobasidium sp. 428]
MDLATDLNRANQVLAYYRHLAREAQLPPMHEFVQGMLSTGECTWCITENFDGLETRGRPGLDERVIRLKGFNEELRCSSPGCRTLRGSAIDRFSADFLKGLPVPCPTCVAKHAQRTSQRGNPGQLSANVYFGEKTNPKAHVQKTVNRINADASGAQVLLIAGTSLLSQSTFAYIEEIVSHVRERNGVVVYINNGEIAEKRTKYIVDYHLRMDVQACAEMLLSIQKSGTTQDAADIWGELAEPTLTADTFNPGPPDLTKRCNQCGLAIQDALLTCRGCKSVWCYEQPDQNPSTMCVALHEVVALAPGATIEESIAGFQCLACYDHNQESMYPHLTRPTAFFYDPPAAKPRLVAPVFYLPQFWPDAEHMISAISNSWASESWECITYPVPLIAQNTALEPLIIPWPPGTYMLLAVYITHGLGGGGYQLTDTLEVAPVEFFERTTAPIRLAMRQAKSSVAIVLACGELYQIPEKVWEIRGHTRLLQICYWSNQSPTEFVLPYALCMPGGDLAIGVYLLELADCDRIMA